MSTFALRCLSTFGLTPQKLVLLAGDLLSLLGTALLVLLLRLVLGDVNVFAYTQFLWELLLLAPVFGLCFGLYQGISLPPHRELKALCLTSTLTYAVILGNLFMTQSSDSFSRAIIAGSWLLSLATLPVMRGLCRRYFSRCSWWHHALIVFDTSERASRLCEYLRQHPERGLFPVKMCCLPENEKERNAELLDCERRWPDASALLIARPCDSGDSATFAAVRRVFGRVLILPELEQNVRASWLTPRDLGFGIGLLVRQNLRDKKRLALKRGLDIALCLLFLPILLPLFAFLALLIRLDSKGAAIYRQRRVGQGGKSIDVCKFRTMVHNADAVLKDYLEGNPALKAEWEQDHKLKHDPRITRVGAFLRKTSLDELPQLVNVVLGDMSLVGPRPIVEAEKEKYGDVYEDYCRVKPGITGLWQISGRNNTTYDERVSLDHYYISNWSMWMDLWILGRTVPVVLTGYGAY